MARSGVIRRLWPIELDRIEAHLLRLDPESRRLRFGGVVGPAQIEAHCADIDWRGAVVVGYLEADALRGLGELLPATVKGARSAELAVSAEGPWRNRGIGTELMRRLIVAARNRLIGRLDMICLIDNDRVLRLARRLDGRLSFERGEALARIEPPWPTLWTLLEETLQAAPVGQGAGRKKAARPPGPGRRRRVQVGRKRLKSRTCRGLDLPSRLG
jgi:ribosomal protein S18 acetylase RimI-like enzyme